MQNNQMQGNIQKIMSEALERQLEDQVEKEIEIRIRIISAAYDKASAYANIIILAGYAAIFTTWSLTKDYLPENAAMTIAMMIGLSLFVFCGWEVFKMIHNGNELNATAKILVKGLPPKQFASEIKKLEIEHQKQAMRMCQWWYGILAVTVSLGFGGALILFYNFAANLLALPFWPQ